jgi:hypothetical protein
VNTELVLDGGEPLPDLFVLDVDAEETPPCHGLHHAAERNK